MYNCHSIRTCIRLFAYANYVWFGLTDINAEQSRVVVLH